MKLSLTFLILLTVCLNKFSIAQNEEPENYAIFLKQFVKDFNESNYSHIVFSAAASFLKEVPENKLTDFLSMVKNNAGKIQLMHFKYFDDKGSAVYHVELEKTWFNFIVRLNSDNKIIRLVILDPNYNEELPLVRNKTKMQLPFEGTWYVFWGGDSEDNNYHVIARSQKNAFDFVMRDSLNKSFRNDGKTNEDYYAFGQRIFSPCDGEVIKVINDVNENIPGKMNPAQLTGNTVVIKSGENEYVLMAHFKMHSIEVKEGEKIRANQFIGLCGNSGNSSEPHLHLHIMDAPDLDKATGIKCYFDSVLVNSSPKLDYSPLKGDRIQRPR